MALLNNLYPPITKSYQPSFIRTYISRNDETYEDPNGCRIYFALPQSVTEQQVNKQLNQTGIQMTVVYQNTNITALRTDWYPLGIKLLYDIQIDPNIETDYKYYVRLLPQQLKDKQFLLNQHYKVQLRFFKNRNYGPRYSEEQFTLLQQQANESGDPLDVVTATDETTLLLNANWLENSLPYCSEWSSVCVIKGISRPYFEIKGFQKEANEQVITLLGQSIWIRGSISFTEEELETLKSYRIQLYETKDKYKNKKKKIKRTYKPFYGVTPLVDSGDQFTNYYGINQINYELRWLFEQNVQYTLKISYKTTNEYSSKKYFDFYIIPYEPKQINMNITADPDVVNGLMKITVNFEKPFIGNINIRRTSSKYGFSYHEDIHTTPIIMDALEQSSSYVWKDRTIESGIWYKYAIQTIDSYNNRSHLVEISNPVICIFEDMFLTNSEGQLNIKLNPTLSNFKYNVNDSQQVSLGAKYPFFSRNAENYYRTFTIGGLIASYVDTTNWYDPHFEEKNNGSFSQTDFKTNKDEIGQFTTKADLYDSYTLNRYNSYNQQNNIKQEDDYIYEREFREKVYDFLYKNNIKLFRSTTEGNILVKLTDIQFQPNEQLSRRLYSFTATATEIDECNITNYNIYDIQPIGEAVEVIKGQKDHFGNLQGQYNREDGNLIKLISTQYKSLSNEYSSLSIDYLKYLKIEIEDEAMAYVENEPYFLVVINNKTTKIPVRANPKANENEQHRLNYGYLEIGNPDDNAFSSLKITNLYIPTNNSKLNVSIDYMAHVIEREPHLKQKQYSYIYQSTGQLFGTFTYGEYLMNKIYDKYTIVHDDLQIQVKKVFNLRFEGPPGTILYIKQQGIEEPQRIDLINGYFNFVSQQGNDLITDFCFAGICQNNQDIECSIDGIINYDFILQKDIYEIEKKGE